MAIIELESAPESTCVSEAGMAAAQQSMQVEFKLSDDLRAEIFAEIAKRVDPEKINLAVRLVHDCPRCKLPLDSATTVIVEYRKIESGMCRQQTALAMCGTCADAHLEESSKGVDLLQLERHVIDGRTMAWDG